MLKHKREIDGFITKAQEIVITAHLSPDPDALGAALGLWFYVKNAFPGKKAEVVFEGPKINFGTFLSGFEEIVWVDTLEPVFSNADLVFFLDGSLYNRFTKNSQKIDFFSFKTVCLEHHPEPVPDKFNLIVQDTTATATAQLVAEIFFDDESTITKEVAEALLVGILGDTGNFRFVNPVRARVFSVAQKLVKAGEIEVQLLVLKTIQFQDEILALVKMLFKNCRRQRLGKFFRVTYSYLPLPVLDRYDLPAIKDAYHYFQDSILRPLSNTSWTFLVVPDDRHFYSLSFRSNPGGPNVQALARLFSGGGHLLASGGKYPTTESGKEVAAKTVCRKVLETFQKEKIPLAFPQ